MSTVAVVVLLFILLLAGILLLVPWAASRRARGAAPPRERPGSGPGPAAPPSAPPTAPPRPRPDVVAPPAPEAVAEPAAETPPAAAPAPTPAPTGAPTGPVVAPAPEAVPAAKPKLASRIGRTRATFAAVLGRGGRIDDGVWDELEETLLLADVGVTTTTELMEGIRGRAKATGATDAAALSDLLAAEVRTRLDDAAPDRSLHRAPDAPVTVWLLVGVNGVGKTTTCAKLARRELETGNKVLLAAADTFRAAAAEQLAMWADRLGVELVRGQAGGDPGAVVFDAIDAAKHRGVDVVIVDTAGRLHTKSNLMEELDKLRRIADRTPGALQEVLLVLDASTGQNGLVQAREFTRSVGVTGVVLTKLDGTAKGGIVLAIEADLGVPVKLVGLGESADDLVEFVPAEFAAALVE